MYIGLHVKYWLFLSEFYETSFLDTFSKNDQISNIRKVPPMEQSCSMRTHGQTDSWTYRHDFHNFANAPKNEKRQRCTNASLIVSLCKCYFNLVNNFVTLCKCMSPISLQASSPYLLVGLLPRHVKSVNESSSNRLFSS
jgi:hypothetical protein